MTLAFLCFPCIFVLVFRLDSELLKVRWSLAVAIFFYCVCPFPVAWMSGLSGTFMGL